ncbi:MAG: Ig-like domain-containing protein [Oscillospiraceae bacterium]|nr:Ig-like domain-containing protein [Oscillospiraceae bacterium]MBQ9986361.1 Ig-like domain-containing protein [Oscillospiraceae bacterium]
MKKKILSLAIAICMVAAMLPSMVISAGAETVNAEYRIIYDFGTGSGATAKADTMQTTYAQTKGLWVGMASAEGVTGQVQSARSELKTTSDNTWYAIKIRVPVKNNYTFIYMKYCMKSDEYGYGNVYLLDATKYTSLSNDNIQQAKHEAIKLNSNVIDYNSSSQGVAREFVTTTALQLNEGEYIVIFDAVGTNKTGWAQTPAYLILSTAGAGNTNTKYYGAGGTDTPIYTGTVELDKAELIMNDAPARASAMIYKLADGVNSTKSIKHTKTLVEDESIITFESSNKNVATVDYDGNITAVGPGTTEITAMLTDGTYGSTVGAKLTVTAPEEDEDFTNEFTGENGYTEDDNKAFTEAKTKANFYSAVVGGTVEMNETTLLRADTDVDLGTQYSYTAPEKEGHIFRYWAKALTDEKLIVTRNATVKFMPTTETTNLVAVYEPEAGATVSDESFYNANGQLLTGVNITDDGKMPSLPSMTGYGTASAWVQYGTDEEFAAGAPAPTENLMFVAKYGEPTETFAIDVEGGLGTGNYTYGQKVTCTATVPDGMVFKCWTKTPVGGTAKIISLDKEYTFSAWESCTITAVFADEEPVFTGNKFSIILSTMGVVDNRTAYMAEFVGLGDAVEKGIQFGTKRVAMTTDAAQFTAVNDINGVVDANVKGYAILSDGTVIYDK